MNRIKDFFSKRRDTESIRWRKKGNESFKSVTEDLPTNTKVDRYLYALCCYRDSLNAANTDEETSSAAKNAAITEWKLAKFEVEYKEEPWIEIKGWFGQSLKYFHKAFTTGQACSKNELWMDGIIASSIGCWEDLRFFTREMLGTDKDDCIVAIQELIDYIPSFDLKADCFLEMTRYHFNRGINALAMDNYKECLYQMKECYNPLTQAERYANNVQSLQTECSVFTEDINMHTSIALCVQSRITGDGIFEQVLMNEETLNMDMIYEVLDWYKDSIIKVRHLDVKQEAHSLSRIGMVYAKVLKIKFKAKEYLKKSLELAHAIVPFTVTNEKWYKDCTEVLEQYQKETIMHEQEEESKEKAAVLEELKPELAELDKKKDLNYAEFLTFVYKTHPPTKPDYVLDLTKKGDEDDFSLKFKSLQKAIIHYHPDRVIVDVYGLKRKVLNEEITKHLTRRYEQVKSLK